MSYVFGGFTSRLGDGAAGPFNAGSTIPVKWQVLTSGGTLISTTSSIVDLQASACSGAAFPASATGGTTVRFAGDGFIFNWKTEKSWTGCYNFLVTLDDGTTQSASVMMK